LRHKCSTGEYNENIGRRKFLKSTSILAGVPIIAGFPSLFSVANAGGGAAASFEKFKENC